MQSAALAGDGLSQARNGTPRDVTAGRQLLQRQQRHVELADGAERAGQLSRDAAEPPRRTPVGNHGQRLAQAPGGHAGLVDGLHVALAGTGQRPPQRGKALADQHLRRCRSSHALI